MVIAHSLIFYSWQSDLPNSTNRGFIQQALENVTKTIRGDASLQIEPVIDRDTEGIPGSPDISKTIFSKIDQAQIFVCDISIINQEGTTHRPTPNPNVLLELGYALKTLGDSHIIMILNDAFGGPELLPFDLRMRRVIRYHMLKETNDRATERKRLERLLADGIRVILMGLDKPLPGEPIQPVPLVEQIEKRFQFAVTGLGDEKEGVRTNAATLLQILLRSGYEQFYIPIFHLVVANLRLPKTSHSSEDSGTPSLNYVLIAVFKEAFPLARKQEQRGPQFLDATRIQLNSADLKEADLEQIWMPQALLRNADLREAKLNGANLNKADLFQANLGKANLSKADLRCVRLQQADLGFANLSGADISGARLGGASFGHANLSRADLNGSVLIGTKFIGADLTGADLTGTDLIRADLTWAKLSGTNFDGADLSRADFRGATGLTQEQLAAYKAKGAIIDEDPTTSSS